MSIVRIDPEGRRNPEHIAIIVVVDSVPIQCHFRSSSFSGTTIADDGHRPIHLIASNPTEVTVTGPALRTVATGPSTCKALGCCLQGLGLLHRKLASSGCGMPRSSPGFPGFPVRSKRDGAAAREPSDEPTVSRARQ